MSFFSAVAVMFSSMQSFALSLRLPFTRAIQADSPSVGEEIEFKRTVNTDGVYISSKTGKYNFVLIKNKDALDQFIRITKEIPEKYSVQYSEDYFKTGALIFFYGYSSTVGEYTRIESIVKPSPDTLSINAAYYYYHDGDFHVCAIGNLLRVYEISASDAEDVDNLNYNITEKPYEEPDNSSFLEQFDREWPDDIAWGYNEFLMIYDDTAADEICSHFNSEPEFYRGGEKTAFDGRLLLRTGDIIQYKNEAGEVCYAFEVSRYRDVNGDGKITLSDARLALRAAARLESLSDAQCVAATGRGIDYDDEDAVYGKYPKLSDARKVLRVAARLESAR